MKRFFTYSFNWILAIFICFGLSGCVASRLPMAIDSPWEQVNLDTQANPLDIGFIDDQNGFLVGTNRLILETKDGGKHWLERSLDLPEEENFRLISINFKGAEGWIAGQPGLVMHTTDEGQHWTRLNLGNKLPGDPYLITTLGEDEAELATTAGAIYRTTNAGLSWEGRVNDASGGVRDLRRTADGKYVSVSSLGNFFATLQKGSDTWEPHQRASSKRVQSVGYKPDGSLWMLSRGAEIRFGMDPDDIESWSKPIVPIVNGYNYLDLAWDPNNNVWVAGGNGTLLVSTDQGQSWESDPIGADQPSNLIKILFTSSPDSENAKGFALGERGVLLRWVG